jgi:hypothetical protein
MLDILKFAHKSCHHGSQVIENHLKSTIDTLKKYPVDIIEIDFVFINNQFISAHDYDDIKNGSSLEDWIEEIMKRDLILWIDLKDSSMSFFINSLTRLSIKHLFVLLHNLQLKYKNLHLHLIIGCQYIHAYEELIKQDTFTIIHDLPRDNIYFLENFIPNQYINSLQNIATMSILEDSQNSQLIAIDRKFFTEQGLMEILNLVTAEIIIIYNYNYSDQLHYIKNKHIIHQFNYT